MFEIARFQIPDDGRWHDAALALESPAVIAAGFAGGLITHGSQRATAGTTTLFALPPGGGSPWLVVADRPVRARVLDVTPRQPAQLPRFAPLPDCAEGCRPAQPRPACIEWARHGEQALAYQDDWRIEIDPAWWAGVRTIGARLAVIGHELGHLMGADCQRCADFYAGAVVRAHGLAYRDAALGFDELLGQHRLTATRDLVRGFLHA